MPEICFHTGVVLNPVETYVNVVDGRYNLEDNVPTDEWRPVDRGVVGELLSQGCMLAGLITPR